MTPVIMKPQIKRHEEVVASAGAKFRGHVGTVILTDTRVLWHPVHVDENLPREEICFLDDINHSSQDDSSDSSSDETASEHSASEEDAKGYSNARTMNSVFAGVRITTTRKGPTPPGLTLPSSNHAKKDIWLMSNVN